MQNKNDKRIRLKKKIRTKIKGDSLRPRLTVFRSNKFIYAQVINDIKGVTLAQANDLPRHPLHRIEVKVKADAKMNKSLPAGRQGTKMERAKEVGRLIGKICLEKKINRVVFDRNGFKYTGRIKSVADEARASGLKF